MNKVPKEHSVYVVLSLPESQVLVDKIVQLSLDSHCQRMPLCVFKYSREQKDQDSLRRLVEIKFAHN